MDPGAQHPHPLHVGVLALDIGLAHEDLALHAHQGADGRGGDPVLAGAGLGDDARLPHLPGEQDLADGVVDLVGAGMIAVLPLQEEAAAILAAHPLGIVQGRGASGIILEQAAELLLELVALDDRQIGLAQFIDTLVQNLGNVGTAKFSVEPVFIHLVTHIGLFFLFFRHKKSLSRSRQALSCKLISLHGCSAHEF